MKQVRWLITALSVIAALVVTVAGQDYYRSGGGGTVTSPATVAVVQGGSGTTSTLTLQSTSGAGTTGADIVFKTGNNGGTEDLRILNSGVSGFGGLGGNNGPFGERLTVQSVSAVAPNTIFVTNDYARNSAGSAMQMTFGAASGNTYAAIDALTAGGASVGHLVLTPSGGRIGISGLTAAFPALKRSGTTLQVRLADDSGDAPVSASLVTAPLFQSTAAKVLVQGTGTGATQLSATQTTAPTCSSNCGTSPSIAGTDTFMTVTMGATGSPASGWVVTFNGTWAAAPSCVVQMAKAGMAVGKQVLTAVTTTTTLTAVTNGTAPATSDQYHIHCGGIQ